MASPDTRNRMIFIIPKEWGASKPFPFCLWCFDGKQKIAMVQEGSIDQADLGQENIVNMQQEIADKKDFTEDLARILQCLYEEQAKTWIADGEEVPSDMVAMEDGLLPVILRQGYEIAKAIGRSDLFDHSVVLQEDKTAVTGFRASVHGLNIEQQLMMLKISQLSFRLLGKRENVIDAYDSPEDPLQLIKDQFILRGLRSFDLFENLEPFVENTGKDPFAAVLEEEKTMDFPIENQIDRQP